MCDYALTLEMESKGDSSIASTPHLPNITTLNFKVTPDRINGNNYKDVKMAIGGSWRLDYIDGSIKKLMKDDPKY